MKVSKWAILLAMAAGLTAGMAFAQSGLRQPVTPVGFEYGSYDYYAQDEAAPSPSDKAAAPAPVANGAMAPAAGGCCDSCAGGNGCADGCAGGNGCGCDDHCKLECETCEPCRLFDCCCLKQNNASMRGWLNAGWMGNASDPASNFNGPVTFADRDDGQFNQFYFLAEKVVDTGGCGWDLGGRVDLLYGSDYRFTIARGLDAHDDFTAKWNSDDRFYGLAMPQAYVEVGYNNLSVKVGHFYTIIEYEVVTAPDNFFYTHAYTMQYGEPFTHTGILATYKANDQFSLIGGVTNGWDNFEDVYGEQSFLGGATFTASDGNSKLAYALSVGDEEETFATVQPTDTRFVQSVVYSRTITDRTSMVVQSDWGVQENAFGSGEDAEWYGVNSYLFYKYNCCWTWGVRAEWFRDDDGFRVAPAGDYPNLGFSNNPASAGGFEGNFYEISLGANYKPTWNPNFILRPELRYDWYDGAVNALGNEPYDDGASDNQFLYGFDAIYLF
jgi:Putative beta-barrel porin-2, OmpL-like. bbp2